MPEASKILSQYADYIHGVVDIMVGNNNNKEKALKFIEDVTNDADEVQKQVLSEILSRSANAEYLQRNGLNGCTDRETFKKVMPVVKYEDIKPDIDRIANGDTSPILCSQPILEFLTRSVQFNHTNLISFIFLLIKLYVFNVIALVHPVGREN